MKKQKQFICLLILICFINSGAILAGDKGGISNNLVKSFQSQSFEGRDKTIANILANKDIKEIALNRERYIAHNKFVNFKIETSDITNQKGSGRCWMFSGLNILRPQAMRNLKVKKIEFSENYLHFWDKMEKMNLFLQQMVDFANKPLDDRELESVISSPEGDGGWWTYFTGLVKKYGLVPIEAMPETYNSSATGRINGFLALKVKEYGLELRSMANNNASDDELKDRKHEMLGEIYRLLVLHLGQPPSEFTWRHESSDTTVEGSIVEKFTPQEFFKAAVTDNLDDFVPLFNFPGKEYFKNYEMALSRNMYDEPDFTILNVPVDTMRKYAALSILDSMPVWFACDVGKENYSKDGIMALDIYDYESILDTKFELPKADLMHMNLIGSNHAMAFMGIDTADGQPVKWLVENSWGSKNGDDGKWYMYNDWFDRYMYGVIIHKRYLTEELLDISETDPIVVPPWDPMSALSRLK